MFEGVIDYDMSVGGMSMQIRQTVKGSHVRQEMDGPMGTMISLTNANDDVMTTILPDRRAYMQIDTRALTKSRPSSSSLPQPGPEDFRPTGEKETIAGQPCEHYAYTREDLTFDMCIASGLGFVPFAHPAGMGRHGDSRPAIEDNMEAWRARFGEGFVPLEMEMTANGGAMVMRATAIERKPVPDALFEIPTGYAEMKMPESKRYR